LVMPTFKTLSLGFNFPVVASFSSYSADTGPNCEVPSIE
jgi:hypothetical protein